MRAMLWRAKASGFFAAAPFPRAGRGVAREPLLPSSPRKYVGHASPAMVRMDPPCRVSGVFLFFLLATRMRRRCWVLVSSFFFPLSAGF